MSTSESILFIGLPIVSFTIGYAVGIVAVRRRWHLARTQLGTAAACLLVPLAFFFVLELRSQLAAEHALGDALQQAAITAGVLALACLPLAPIPAFIGAQLAGRLSAPPQDDAEG